MGKRCVNRKSMLYKTGVEYADYTMNHVEGCSHGCKYPCYAYLLKKRFGKIKTYEEWCKPVLVSNTLELLAEEIPKLKGKIKNVHLSFTTDPFMFGHPEIGDLSIQAIAMLNAAGIPCTVLTKGILPMRLSEYSLRNSYGITLVSLSGKFRTFWEPGSATFGKRISALENLHNRGCKTWVSIEPYPTPNIIDQGLDKILDEVSFVDKIVFGRMHYNGLVSKYSGYKDFYREQAKIVVSFCKKNGIKYHIKKGTM